jgi:ABC-type branched-subunit amino acid transport system substrate-binding protein
MGKKKILLTSALILVIVAVGYLVSCRRNNPPPGQLRVAAILNLTGPSARFDAVKQQSLELAHKRLKELYPNTPLEFKTFDAAGGPEATTVAIRQALDWGASYFLSGTSPTALAIASQVRGRTPEVVQIANAANPEFGPPRSGEYRFWPDWKQEADIVQQILNKESINKVFLIHSADPYSEALTKELKERVGPIPGFVISEMQYDPASTPDFRPPMLRAKNDGTQAIVIFGLPPGINALMAQMAEVRWDRALIGGVNTNLAVSGYDAAQLKGPLWLVETEAMQNELPEGTEAQLFRTLYKQQYNEVPPFHSLYLADALYFIAAAWNNSPDINLSEVERIKQVREFNGPSGHIEINPDNTLQFNMTARRVR